MPGTKYPNGLNVPEGKLYIADVAVTPSAAEINKLDGMTATKAELNLLAGCGLTALQLQKMYSRYTVTVLDGSTGKKACSTNGVSAITGGTGIADMSLAAPSDGDVATIRINSLTSGSVVVTCAAGVTLNGTNNVATFDAANETLVLAYKAANTWQVVENIGGVALSTAG
jgi:hypothetical protein